MKRRGFVGVLLALVLVAVLVWLALPGDRDPARGAVDRGTIEASSVEPQGRQDTEVREPTLEERIAALEADEEDDEDPADRVVRVLDENDRPIEGAMVQFGERNFLTDAEGRAEFQWPVGDYVLEFDIRHPAFANLLERRADNEGEQVFRMSRGHTIRGSVQFPDGRPAPEILVRAWSDEDTNRPQCYSNERGEFVLTGVADRRVHVEAEQVGASVVWAPGDPSPTLVARESLLLVRVRSATGAQLDDVRVHGSGLSKKISPRNVFLGVLSPGSDLKLSVYADGHEPQVVRCPPAGEHARLTEVQIELVPFVARKIRLNVTQPQFEPKSVVVARLDEEGDALWEARLGESPVVVESLPPKPVRLKVWDAKNPLLFRILKVEAAGQTVDVELPRGSRLRFVLPTGIEGQYWLLVARIEDDLSVPWRLDRKSGWCVSASLVPAGRYFAEVQELGEHVSGRRPIIHHVEFDVEEGVDHEIDWNDPD